MVEVEYLTIAEFAEKAGVSKQAIYKQVNNENSQIAPYLLREGKKTLIKVSALAELYKVEAEISTSTTPKEEENTTLSTPKEGIEVEATTQQTTQENEVNQPINPISTQENQPLSTDYIEFLKAQVAELKAEKAEVEKRLNDTIKEKDGIIKDQSAQLAELAKQVAQIADKALITTSQQQYLTAAERVERQDPPPSETTITEIDTEPPKKGFWSKLFGK